MPYRARSWWSVALCGVVLFALSFPLRALDASAGRALLGAPVLLLAAGAFGFLGAAAFLAPFVAVVAATLAALGRWWGAARVVVVAVAGDASARLLKLAAARPRPGYMLVETGGFSFPSGHATGGAAFAVLLAWFALRNLRGRALVASALGLAVLWAFAQAASRLVLGVHYLSDVVGGVGLGLAVGGGALAASIAVERRYAARSA